MTDKITIDLYVVEQALEALREAQVLMERFQDEKLRRSAIEALRAALEQPQNHVPDAVSMVPDGWKLVPAEPTDDMFFDPDMVCINALETPFGAFQRIYKNLLTAAPQPPTTEQSLAVEKQLVGVVGWRNHIPNSVSVVHWTGLIPQVGTELYIGQQSQVEQEPVGKLISDPYEGHIFVPYGDRWPFNEDLYTHPQNLRCKSNQARLATLWGYVKAEPLTDEQIMELFRGVWTDGTQAGPVTPMALRVARAIERAHGIGGEE